MKDKRASQRINVSTELFFYISYICFLSITDIFALFLYYLNSNEYLTIAIAISLCITIAGFVYYKRFVSFSEKLFDKRLLPYYLIILCIALLRGISPDLNHDVSMARVYWQEPGFVDNINTNVFPAGFTFFFPLSDRLFYYPRILLGYRLGTLFNAYLLVMIMAQVRNLIDFVAGTELNALQKKIRSEKILIHFFAKVCLSVEFFSFVAITTFYTIADLGTYMIDLVAIPLLLWLLMRILQNRKNDAELPEMLFFALLCGLSFALKFTNVIFIAPLLIIYLWQNRKVIRITQFVICLVIGLLPSIGYLLYAYTSTGNPVYWTFNALFKSPYYPDTNFKDTRWGPQNWIEFIFWPIHLVVNPTEHISEISKLPQIYLLCGHVSATYGVYKGVKSKNSKILSISIIYVIFTLLWLKSTGYPRYAIICEILAVVLSMYFVQSLFCARRVFRNIGALILLCSLVLQCGLNLYGGILNLYDWSWREKISLSGLTYYQKENCKYFLKDRGEIGTDEQRDKIDIFVSTHIRHSIMRALDKEAPIINARYIIGDLAAVKEDKGIDYYAYYFDQLKEAEKQGQSLFDVVCANEWDEFISSANAIGAEIISLEEIPGYFVGRDTPILLGYSLTGKDNTCVELKETQVFSIPQGTKRVTINGIACIPSFVQWSVPSTKLQIALEISGEDMILKELDIPQHKYVNIDETFDVSAITKTDVVTLRLLDDSGEPWVTNIINLEIINQ